MAQGLSSYLGKQQEMEMMGQRYQMLQGATQQRQENVAQYKQGLQGQLSPEDMEQVAPGMGNWVNSFQKTNGRLPTVSEGMKALHLGLTAAQQAAKAQDTTKEDARQDRLENNSINRLTQARQDPSIVRLETQRDGAKSAYMTLDNAIKQGGQISPAAYYDTLGQLWKARTGASPTDQSLRDLDTKTFKGDLNKVQAYFTGNPAQPGATTVDNLKALRQFVADTGTQVDSMHAAAMAPHLIKPAGLSDDRWQPIAATHRGSSFQDFTGYKPGQQDAMQSSQTNKDPLGLFTK